MGFFTALKDDLFQSANNTALQDVRIKGESEFEGEFLSSEDDRICEEESIRGYAPEIPSVEEPIRAYGEESVFQENISELQVETKTAGTIPEAFAESDEAKDVPRAVEDENIHRTRSGEPEKTRAAVVEEKAELPDVMQAITGELSVITLGMVIKGDVTVAGPLEILGTVNGNVDAAGDMRLAGRVNGDVRAATIRVEGAKLCGELVSAGAVWVDAGSVVIGNITGTEAKIAGLVKGDIDVKGPVTVQAGAMVVGNIKCKSVEICAGAGIEGMCSQCYAEIRPTAFFEDYKV